MDIKALYEAYKGKIAEAKALAAPFEGKDMPKETAQLIDKLLGEADGVKAQIDQAERIQKAEKYLAEPLEPKSAKVGAPAGPQSVEVVKDEADQPFESDGQFFKAVKHAAYYPGDEDPRLRPLKESKATGMSEGVPADGGYLLHPQMAARIFERMYGAGDILSRITTDPVTGNSMLYNAVDETSRAEGSRWGGLRGYWGAEAGTKTASKPKFRQMELKLKKVYALCYATDEQLEDTANLESWLNRTVPEELRFQDS